MTEASHWMGGKGKVGREYIDSPCKPSELRLGQERGPHAESLPMGRIQAEEWV